MRLLGGKRLRRNVPRGKHPRTKLLGGKWPKRIVLRKKMPKM
jgi:hypothetical protein